MDPNDWSLDNAGLLESIATLAWANDNNTGLIQNVLTARVGYELYQRLSGQREVDALRNKTIAAIATYIKEHPRASKSELQKEITKQITDFANELEKL